MAAPATQWSFQKKILVLTVGITVLLSAVSLYSARYMIGQLKVGYTRQFELISDSIEYGIAAQFFERYGDIQAFAANPGIQSSSRDEIVGHLNTYIALYGIYDLITVVDKTGKLVAVNSKSPAGKEIQVSGLYQKNFSEESWFKATLAGQFIEDKERNFSGTYVEDPRFSPLVAEAYSDENAYNNVFAAQLKNRKGEVIGVIANHAGFRWVEGELVAGAQMLKDSGYTRGDILLVNKQGVVLSEVDQTQAQNGAYVASRDKNVVGALNLSATNNAVAEVLKGKDGLTETLHTRKKEQQLVAYNYNDQPKFTPALGWSTLTRDSIDDVYQVPNAVQRILLIILILLSVCTVIVSVRFSKKIADAVREIIQKLGTGSQELAQVAASSSQSARQISDGATEQSAAIQETAAAVDQVNAMIKKNSDNAAESKEVSAKSRSFAEQGKHSVEDMIQAIGDISSTTRAMMSQVDEGNTKISEIVKVIAEIGNKTKVINDIVFQTKLLSFNASVEAARAGEHGKGFAVVAEEVGNLAQMSGNAAKEISEMLDTSIQQVESIVNETKSKVSTIMSQSATTLERGTKTAEVCGEALENILKSAQQVDAMVTDIAAASKEQAQGVSEINKAINQLDQVTQESTGVAQRSAASADQLSQQSQDLQNTVNLLISLIEGRSSQASPSTSRVTQVSGNGSHSKKEPVKKSLFQSKDKSDSEPGKSISSKNGSQGKKGPEIGQKSNNDWVPSKDDPRFEDL